ncbi:hypothetical protein VNO78_00168 [Psophocarpus tetragonolobus]|uniref:Phosphoglycerate kinase n=1 Tax=Psophocarpus tetragonolobus TaxID=3891 RepID=A0AAN9T018_PSOTE
MGAELSWWKVEGAENDEDPMDLRCEFWSAERHPFTIASSTYRFLALLSARPPRRPKKRLRIVQKHLNTIFPGLWLDEVTAESYKMADELDYLVGVVANPKKPFATIMGGSKVSTKIGVIESLLEKVNIFLLGGGMVFTFYKALGYSVGSSLVEADKLNLAKSLLEKAEAKWVSLLLPTDVVIANKFVANANNKALILNFNIKILQMSTIGISSPLHL